MSQIACPSQPIAAPGELQQLVARYLEPSLQQGEASRQTRSGAVHTHVRTVPLQPRAVTYVQQGRLDAAALASLRELQRQTEGGDEQASKALLFCLRVLQLWVSTEYLKPPPAALGGSAAAAAAAAAAGSDGVAEVVDLTAEEEPLSDPDGQLISLMIVRESQLAAAVKPDPGVVAPAEEAPLAEMAPAAAGGSAAPSAAAASTAASVAAGPAQRQRQQSPSLLNLPPGVLALIAAQLKQRDRARFATCCRTLLAASRACSSKWWPVLRLVCVNKDAQPGEVCYTSRWLQRHEPAATALHLRSSSAILRGLSGEWGRALFAAASQPACSLPFAPPLDICSDLALLPFCPTVGHSAGAAAGSARYARRLNAAWPLPQLLCWGDCWAPA